MSATAPQALTPYDTGERCEPKLWQPDRAAVLAAMNGDEGRDVGNVDFEDDEGHTVVTIHVSRSADGIYTVHVVPFVDEEQLEVERHDEPIV